MLRFIILLVLCLPASVLAQKKIFIKGSTGSSSNNTIVVLNGNNKIILYGDYLTLSNKDKGSIKIFRKGFYDWQDKIENLHDKDTIDLIQIPIELKEVKIYHDSRKDSIEKRKIYEKEFNYKPFELSKAIVVSPLGIGVNIDKLYGALSKKNKSAKKLKAMLIKDEQEKFVDRVFSKKLISQCTNLKNEQLDTFRATFRPDYFTVKKMSQYELMIYIKNSYEKFIK